ncbi:sulfatase [Myxococcota bacterium]|nr:sulfatase [Myxococcota bacterium]
MLSLLSVVACGGAPHLEDGGTPLPPGSVGEPYAFARRIDEIDALSLPQTSRPGAQDTPEAAPIFGPFTLTRTQDGVQVYETLLPVRMRELFYYSAPRGMKVVGADGKAWPYGKRDGKPKKNTWAITETTLILRLPGDRGAPEDGELSLVYPKASERERLLNLKESGLSQADFVARSVQLGPDTRTGLFLPAPARAEWDVVMPPSATLQLDAVVLPPELAERARSDGAELIVSVTVEGGATEEALRMPVAVGRWEPVRLDLSRFAGKKARIGFSTEGGGSTELDYVFLAEPTLYSPAEQPKKVLLVFLDTLRPDHLGMYGYERDTSPKLDAWAKGAVVFEEARSVAPWTLPSTRTILSGRQPELWRRGPILPEQLAEAGWATGAFVGNVYLSSNFDMAQGWSQHGCVNWPIAEVQVEKVQDFLSRHPGRDTLVMLHTMDAHLPYTEPSAYRDLWAGPAPAGLDDGDTRTPILNAMKKDREAVSQWVTDRYDQNIRYLDDQVSALLEVMGEDTTVVIFADHGEELWDHGGFEHGHTLYDELLRVPLIVKSPGLPPGRIDAPVSLLDITPTVLELVGLKADGADGRSLVSAAKGDATALALLEGRAQAFGRPLYGDERWGSLSNDIKWTSSAGKEAAYDLSADPGEKNDLRATTDLSPLRAAMGQAIGREAPLSWRVELAGVSKAPSQDEVLEIRHPGGLRAAWLGGDPLKGADMTLTGPDPEGVVRVTLAAGYKGSRELYLVPAGDPLQLSGLSFTLGGQTAEVVVPDAVTAPDGSAHTLGTARAGGRRATVTWGFAPWIPQAEAVSGMDDEMSRALEALGYQAHDEEGEPPPPPPPPPPPTPTPKELLDPKSPARRPEDGG